MKNRANKKRFPHRMLGRTADSVSPSHTFCRCRKWATDADLEKPELRRQYRDHLAQAGVL